MTFQRLFFFILFLCPTVSNLAQECNKTSVYFASNKYKLKNEAKKTIDSLLNSLDTSINYLMELHAYTDSMNTPAYNFKLSQNRNESVRAYIQSSMSDRVVFSTMSFGELTNHQRLEKNRRVEIYFVPLDADFRVTIRGDLGEKAKITWEDFNSSSYCKEKPKIISSFETLKNGSKAYFYEITNLRSHQSIKNCKSAEFRFPAGIFNSFEKIDGKHLIFVPVNWYVTYVTGDSLQQIGYDSLTNEYVVHNKCYNRRSVVCQSRTICYYYKFTFPEEITSIKTSIYMEIYPGMQYKHFNDTHEVKLFCPRIETIHSYGLRNGELLFAKCTRTTLDKNKQVFQYLIHYPVLLEEYKPLEYTKTNLRLKIPKAAKCDSIGYYLEPYDYFIPIEWVKKQKFKAMMLKIPFDLAVYTDGKREIIPFKKVKKKYIKRRKRLKIKVRTKDLNH